MCDFYTLACPKVVSVLVLVMIDFLPVPVPFT